MWLIPTYKQWKRWSLPTKISVIAAYITFLWFLLFVFEKLFFPGTPPLSGAGTNGIVQNSVVIKKFEIGEELHNRFKGIENLFSSYFKNSLQQSFNSLPESNRFSFYLDGEEIKQEGKNLISIKSNVFDKSEGKNPEYIIKGSLSIMKNQIYSFVEIITNSTNKVFASEQIYLNMNEELKLSEIVENLAKALFEKLYAQLRLPLRNVTVSSQPGGADIWVYGVYKGKTTRTIKVSPGEHTIKTKFPDSNEKSHHCNTIEHDALVIDDKLERF